MRVAVRALDEPEVSCGGGGEEPSAAMGLCSEPIDTKRITSRHYFILGSARIEVNASLCGSIVEKDFYARAGFDRLAFGRH